MAFSEAIRLTLAIAVTIGVTSALMVDGQMPSCVDQARVKARGKDPSG